MYQNLIPLDGQDAIARAKAVQARIRKRYEPIQMIEVRPAPEVPKISVPAAIIFRGEPIRITPDEYSTYFDTDPAEIETNKPIKIADIVRVVAWHYNYAVMDMMAQRRSKHVSRARQIAMYLCRELTARSMPEIGYHMGGRDHTTILHGVRKIASLLETDPELQADIAALRSQLTAGR